MKNLKEFTPKDGRCYIVDCWKNENSKKDQCTLQFAQIIKKQLSANKFLEFEQGITNEMVITNLKSISRIAAEKAGLFPFPGKPVDASSKYGFEVAIDLHENTEQNPLSPNQEPLCNPSTGEICMYNGKPIYRHTKIEEKELAKQVFLLIDKTTVTIAAPREFSAANVSSNPLKD